MVEINNVWPFFWHESRYKFYGVAKLGDSVAKSCSRFSGFGSDSGCRAFSAAASSIRAKLQYGTAERRFVCCKIRFRTSLLSDISMDVCDNKSCLENSSSPEQARFRL